MQYWLKIDCWRKNKRSINEKPLNPNREQRRKNKRSRLRFFSNNPKHALPLQRGVEQFNYCELSSGQVSRRFLVVLRDSVDLMCSWNRGSRSYKLNIYPERGNSLCRLNVYCRKSDLLHQREGKHHSHSCLPSW